MVRLLARALTIAAVVGGCGSVNPATIDAGPDAKGGADALPQGMAVVVTKTEVSGVTGAAQANVPVISIGADGTTVLGSVTTDANGHASVMVEAGGSVTAVYAHVAPDQANDFQTFVGVKPDDTLNFGGNAIVPASAAMTGYTVSWSAFAGATSYVIYFPCGGVGVGTALTFSTTGYENAYCHQDQMDFLVLAYGGSGTVIGSLFAQRTYAAGGTYPLGSLGTVNTNMTLSFSGLDPSYTQVDYGVYVIQQGRYVYSNGSGGQPTGGAYTGMINQWPRGQGDRTLAYLDLYGAGQFSGITLYDQFSSENTSWTVANPPAIPQIATDAEFVSPAAGIGNWFTTGTGTMTGQVVEAYWTHTFGANQYTSSWSLVVPPDALALVFPQLPSPYKELTFQPQDQDNGFDLEGFLIPSVANYDALRAMSFSEAAQPTTALLNGDFDRVLIWGY